MDKNNKIYEFLTKLGLNELESKLYCALLTQDSMSLLTASRITGIERTRLYRMIEELTKKGIVEEVLEHKAKRIRAANPEAIRHLIAEQERKAKELTANYGEFEQIVQTLLPHPTTQVRYFRGVEGIKQILWNETKAKGSAVGYTHRNLEEVVGQKYFNDYARELEKNKINFRDLRTDSFLASTKTDEYIGNPIATGFWRYLPDKVLHLTHNLDIYNDVMAIYYWGEGDVFGVEIQNQQIADTQRSIFEALWELATQYKLPKEFDNPIDMSNFTHLIQDKS